MNKENQIKTIIITGSNRGLGLTFVESIIQLIQNQKQPNHNIIMTARDKDKGMKEFLNLKNLYPSISIYFYQLDVAEISSIDNFYKEFEKDFSQVDILVNNAGIYVQGDVLRQEFQPIEDIDQCLNVNFFGLVNLTEKFLPILSKNGKIIQISSNFGLLKYQPQISQQLFNDETITMKQLLEIVNDYKQLNIQKNNQKYSKCIYAFSKVLVNTYNRFILSKLMKDNQLCLSLSPGSCDTDMGKQGIIDDNKFPDHSAQDGVNHILFITFEIPFEANPRYNGAYFSYNCKEPSQF